MNGMARTPLYCPALHMTRELWWGMGFALLHSMADRVLDEVRGWLRAATEVTPSCRLVVVRGVVAADQCTPTSADTDSRRNKKQELSNPGDQ